MEQSIKNQFKVVSSENWAYYFDVVAVDEKKIPEIQLADLVDSAPSF